MIDRSDMRDCTYLVILRLFQPLVVEERAVGRAEVHEVGVHFRVHVSDGGGVVVDLLSVL
jgi:hypothetical protein